MTTPSDRQFAPRDGALLDLESLDAVASMPHRLLSAWAGVLHPRAPGIVLEGLEPEAPLSAVGPPGTRRPDSNATGLRLSPGRFLLRDAEERWLQVEVRDSLYAAWPNRNRSAVEGTLVARVQRRPESAPGGLQVAREEITVEVGFVRPGTELPKGLLPIAAALGNNKDWITDLHRVWAPDHAAVVHVERRLDDIERLIWQAQPEGSVWNRGILGRNWVRYQTMAAASLQAARLALRSRTMTTTERVRLFVALRDQLARSVQPAATALLQFFRPSDGAGPYAAVLSDEGL